MTASDDATARLWSVGESKEVARLISIDSTDYVIATADNYYLASRGAINGVAFREGNSVYPWCI